MEQPRAGARSPDLPIMVVYDVRDAPRNRVAPRPADRGRGQRAAPDDALPPGRLARAARRRARRNPGGSRGGVGSDGAPVRWAALPFFARPEIVFAWFNTTRAA